MLVVHPAFHLFSHTLPRDLQGRFTSNKLVNSSFFCQLVSNFNSAYPRVSGDLEQSHKMLSGNDIQRLLALLSQWGRCFANLKGYQSHLTVTAYTNIFLWSNTHTNFICTGQDGMYLSLENCSIFS